MPEESGAFGSPRAAADNGHVADALFELMPRDAVFALRLLGESRSRLLEHFHALILAELAKLGATPETHPMISAFAETHALTLRDFVVSGVEIAHQFGIEEMERLTGNSTGLLRVDVWDRLKSHIAIAESQFQRQLLGMREQIEGYRAPASPSRAPR